MIDFVFAGLTSLVVLCAVVVTFGLTQVLKRLDIADGKKSMIVVGTLVLVAGWLLLTGGLALSGVLAVWDARPPRFPLVPIIALTSIVLINRTAIFRKLMAATPRHWPVAMQTFRIGVELSFWGLFAVGGAPVQVTFEGRNIDVLVGATAPFVALAIAKFNLRPTAVIVWNIVGLGVLFNAIFTTLTSMPGPQHLNWPGEPFTAFATGPFVWIPAFLAPLAIFLHVVSIRQNLALVRKA
ncbi:MAG: hypothetical protein JWP80_3298 [Pseudomonas sp.]|nr:hypothetical protein [Pseudomonas sp.]